MGGWRKEWMEADWRETTLIGRPLLMCLVSRPVSVRSWPRPTSVQCRRRMLALARTRNLKRDICVHVHVLLVFAIGVCYWCLRDRPATGLRQGAGHRGAVYGHGAFDACVERKWRTGYGVRTGSSRLSCVLFVILANSVSKIQKFIFG